MVNYSTGAIGVPVEKRVAYLRALRPEVAALNMGSMNYAKYSRSRRDFVFSFVFANPFDEIIALLEAMNELGIKPEHECFDLGHVGSLEPLVHKGVLREPLHVSCVHGRARRRAADGAQPRRDGRQHPGRLALGRDRDRPRAVDAGRGRARARRLGARRAGGQLLPAGGEMARSNGDLVARARRMAEDAGRARRRERVAEARTDARIEPRAARGPAGARPEPAAAGRVLLAAAGRLRRRGAQGRGHGAGRLHPLGAAARSTAWSRAPPPRCSSRSTAGSVP